MQDLIPSKQALEMSLATPQIDPIFLSIANLHIQGSDPAKIAESLDISIDRVAQVLDKQEVKEYIRTVFMAQGLSNPFSLRKVATQVVESKLQEAMETGQYTKKDLLDWLKFILSLSESMTPKAGPQTNIQVNNNYDRLLESLRSG